MAERIKSKSAVRPGATGASQPGAPTGKPLEEPGTQATHEQLEREHNRAEHERHAHSHGTEWDSVNSTDTFEPWHDYDLGVMPRGV